jgi:hypothetical protein
MSADPSPAVAGSGCWPIVLIAVGGLISLVSGLCVGGGLIGTVLDLMRGAAPLANVLGVTLTYLVVSAPFLAGGIALVVWGVKMQRRKR